MASGGIRPHHRQGGKVARWRRQAPGLTSDTPRVPAGSVTHTVTQAATHQVDEVGQAAVPPGRIHGNRVQWPGAARRGPARPGAAGPGTARLKGAAKAAPFFGTYICWLTEWQCLPLDRAAITMLATRHVHEV